MRELRQDWRDLFYGFRIALDPKKMMLGFVGILLSLLVLYLLTFAFQSETKFPRARVHITTVLSNPSLRNCKAFVELVHVSMFPKGRLRLAAAGFLGIYGLLMLAIWSLVGGAIMRICAVELARDDRIDIGEAWGFAKKKYLSFFSGPLVPLIGILLLAVCILVAGWLGGIIPFLGPLAVGVFFFLAVIAGFLSVFIAIGGACGGPLMFATIAMEGTDAFDAISRAYSYIFGRPWRLLWYVLVTLVYGVVVTAFVALFAAATLQIALGLGGWAMGSAFEPTRQFLANWTFPAEAGFAQKICAVLIKAAVLIISGLVLGFVASYKATAATIVYSLLRKAVDGTDMTEVYLEEEDEAFEGSEAPAADASAGAAAEASEAEPKE